ncbi:U-box domain-containing protein 52-like [Andrographis paniculata]|uniref:U-box domain-containing protein 52-like n=1 Tax=Andrographis paniculata TaxID=175694 RepID=UPI0021E83BF2|nr:U-box domain-containing protein 52-like [Andrographis paniculata]
MWPTNGMQSMQKLVAVAIDRDKGCQGALKWAVDNVLGRGQTIVLVHVRMKPSNHSHRFHQVPDEQIQNDADLKDLFRPFRVFCTRKEIQCHEIVLDETDVARALIEFAKQSSIEVMVVGAASKASFFRFRVKDIPGTVLKGLPDYCTVYLIHKGKISSTRSACRPAPSIISPLRGKLMSLANNRVNGPDPAMPCSTNSKSSFSGNFRPGSELSPLSGNSDAGYNKSPLADQRFPNERPYEISEQETEGSFANTGRRSVEMYSAYESFESGVTPPRLSGISDMDYQSMDSWQNGHKSEEVGQKSIDAGFPVELSVSLENDHTLLGSTTDEVEAEMRRLKQELKQTMDMYSTACMEELSARDKATALQKWKIEEERKVEEAQLAEEAAMAVPGKKMATTEAALQHAEAAQRLAALEAEKRINAEKKALREAEENNTMLSSLTQTDIRYRKYTIEEIEVATEYFAPSRKIGEGGYGPVFKCYLDHTPAAVKILRPDATHGRAQFQQEVEILSCMRHPNMVLLLGACPEYGCLVYEYLSNGSLEDRLFQRGKTPPLSWRHRFRIAAEISVGLHFLHQNKPEPLVHRDLKPANILLDRNFVSKISDVGLARLVPPSVADNVTQYLLTATAGTFCYIDPEYQQTGMLGVKSDVYSLGIIFLQILTAKPPMGISHVVARAIEQGNFTKILDPYVPDWPEEEALGLAKLALKCSELRRKDRPDLGKVVLPYLNKLREMADDNVYEPANGFTTASPGATQVSMSKGELSYPPSAQSSTGG